MGFVVDIETGSQSCVACCYKVLGFANKKIGDPEVFRVDSGDSSPYIYIVVGSLGRYHI